MRKRKMVNRLNFLFQNKKILVLILIIIAVNLGLFLAVLTNTSTEPIPSPKPTPTSVNITNNLPPQNTISPPIRGSDPNLLFTPDTQEKNFKRIAERKNLPVSEIEIKQRLILPLSGESGTVATFDDFIVEYLQTPQFFMVQLLSNDVESAKTNAQNWFNDQGITDFGICNLPVIFYISEEVSVYLQENKQQFNPLPRSCSQ